MYNMNNYNLIPIGDHCAISIILRKLQLRKQSYPFDWITHVDQLYDTNIGINIEIIENLLQTNDAKNVTKKFLGDAFEKNNNKTYNNIWFPHDNESIDEIYLKYERRFAKLYDDIHNSKNIFLMLTRHKYIEQELFDKIINLLLPYNNENKIIFISGTEHDYLNLEKYKQNVIFKYIYYDISQFYDYDYSDFRPKLALCLKELFIGLGILNITI